MLSISISGCGSLSDKELYNKAVSMPYAISYDAVVDELGKPSKVINELKVKKTGEVISGEYVWAIKGMEDGWLEIHTGGPIGFKETGYCALIVSRDFAKKMAEENKRIYNGTFDSRLGNQVKMDIEYNKLTYYGLVEILGIEGTVLKKAVYPESIDNSDRTPEITYIWFDSEDNSFTATFKNKKAHLVKKNNLEYTGSGKNSKLSALDLYNKAIKMPYKLSYDDLVNELDKPTNVMFESENSRTGNIDSGTYLWGVEGMEHGWIEVSTGRPHNFSKVGYWTLKVSRDLALKVAKENNYIHDGVFSQRMINSLKRSLARKHLTYNQLKELIKCEGVVLNKRSGFSKNEAPNTTYIWFDSQGNCFDARAYDK